VHQIELEMQNEELRRAQAELDVTQARYFDLYDLAPVGYCTLNEKGVIQEANLTAALLLGVARKALVGKPIFRFIVKADQDIYYLHRKQLFETGQPQACELRMKKTDGTSFWAQDWTFTGDIVWTDWSCYKDLTINLDNGLVAPTQTQKKWTDVFSYRLGAEYKLDKNWRLRAGYVYDQSPIHGSSTRSAELPDSNSNEFCLGLGYETRTWGVDLAYSYRMFDSAEDSQVFSKGKYESSTQTLMLSWKYSF
jgi:PAS domain S-box-containing protein